VRPRGESNRWTFSSAVQAWVHAAGLADSGPPPQKLGDGAAIALADFTPDSWHRPARARPDRHSCGVSISGGMMFRRPGAGPKAGPLAACSSCRAQGVGRSTVENAICGCAACRHRADRRKRAWRTTFLRRTIAIRTVTRSSRTRHAFSGEPGRHPHHPPPNRLNLPS